MLALARVSVDVPNMGDGHPEKDTPNDAPTIWALSVGRAVLHSHGGTFSITGTGMWQHSSEQLLSVPTDDGHIPVGSTEPLAEGDTATQPHITEGHRTVVGKSNSMFTTSWTNST